MKSMYRFALLGVLTAAITLPLTVRAEDAAPAPAPAKPDKPKRKGAHGSVTAVDATAKTLTLTDKKGEAKTFTIPDDAKIKVDRKAATLADVKVGMMAMVGLTEDEKTVTSVRAMAPKE